MSKSKCLFISPFYAPELISSGKWNKVVCDGISSRKDLTVICYHPFYPKWKMENDTRSQFEYDVVRLAKSIRFPKKNIFRRIVLESTFAVLVAIYLHKNKNIFTEAILILPPSLFAWIAIKSLRKNPNFEKITTVVHDLQSVHLRKGSGWAKKTAANIVDSIERKIFNDSDKLIFLSSEMQNYSSEKGSQEFGRKSLLAYPFITIKDDALTNNLSRCFDNDKVSLVYSGALGEKQNPDGLLHFLNKLTGENDQFECIIFSEGPHYERLKSIYETSSIKFFGLVRNEEVKEQLFRSSIQIIPQAAETSSGSLPSKLPNILYSKAKLLVITDEGSELEAMLSGIEDVSVQTSWDEESLIAETVKLESEYHENRNMRERLLELFSIEHIISMICEDDSPTHLPTYHKK